MIIEGIIWLDEIIDKLAWKHNVQQKEVIEILENNPYFRFVERGHRKGENVYAAMSQTNGGRYLIIFFVYKENKNIIILSARDMTSSERKMYDKR